MPDPYSPVQPGEPVVFSATAWNSMLGAGKDWRRRQTSQGVDPLTTSRSATIIRVKNESEIDLARSTILGLGDPIFTPDDSTVDDFLREVTFRGVVPDITKHRRKFCILLEPALTNRVVRAYLAGVCPVIVEQQHEAHEYANMVDTSVARMESSVHGHARILWREGLQGSGYGYYDGGIQWAVVMLGVTGSSGAVGKSGGISARSGTTWGTGTVDIYRDDGGSEDGPIETIDVLNPGTAISSGKWVAVEWDAWDTAFVGPLECE